MAQYIDKDAVLAEIEKLKGKISDGSSYCNGWLHALRMLQLSLGTLEVKVTNEVKIGETQIYLEDDGGEQPYDGKQWLDLSCNEYEIPKALFKDGDNVEILIRKAQKGK